MPVQDRQFDRRMVSGAVAALPQPLREHRHQHHADQHMQAMKTGRDVVDEEEQLFAAAAVEAMAGQQVRSEEHTSELQSLMRISYAVFCLKKKTNNNTNK